MTHKSETKRDIAQLFSNEEQAFESEAFVGEVTDSIRRRSLTRRIVLSSAALVGGILTGTQLTSLAKVLGLSTPELQSLGELQVSLTETANPDPLWIAAALMVAGFCAMLVISERA